MPTAEVTQLLRQISQTRNEDAITKLWTLYHPRLLKIARRGLEQLPDDAVADEDIVQSSLNSFFKAVEGGRTDQIENREELWGLLLTITVRKLGRQHKRVHAQKRQHSQVSLESCLADPVLSENNELFLECDEIIESLKDHTLRTIAIMRLEGYTVSEIADKLNVAHSTIKRKLRRIREIWTADADEDGESLAP